MLAFLAGIIGVVVALFLQRIWVEPMMYALAVVGRSSSSPRRTTCARGRKRRMTEELFGKFVSRKIVDRIVARRTSSSSA